MKKYILAILLTALFTCPSLAVRGRYDNSPAVKGTDDIVDGSVQIGDLHSTLEGVGGMNNPIPLKIVSNLGTDETWTSNQTIEWSSDKFVEGLSTRSMFIPAVSGKNYEQVIEFASIHDQTSGLSISGSLHHWFWCADWSQVRILQVKLVPDAADESKYYVAHVVIDRTGEITDIVQRPNYGGLDGEWSVVIEAPWRTALTGGVAAWTDGGTTIDKIIILAASVGATPVEVYYGGTYEENWPKAAICLGFDGVYRSANDNAFPMLTARGWKGTLFPAGVLTYDVGAGTAGLVNTTELLAYHDLGWDVVPHGWSGQYDTNTTSDALTEDIMRAMKWGERSGFHHSSKLASPSGSAGTSVRADTRDYVSQFFKAGRGEWRQDDVYRTATGYPAQVATYSWMKSDYMQITATAWHGATMAVQKAAIDSLVGCRGFKMFYTHKVDTLADPMPDGADLHVDDWNEIVAYIDGYVQAGTLEVITFTEYLNRTLYRVGPMTVTPTGGTFIRENTPRPVANELATLVSHENEIVFYENDGVTF